MSMFYTIFFIGFMASLILNAYLLIHRPEISVENAKKELKEFLIRMMLFYQENYNGSDQLVHIASWINNVRDKIKNAPVEQKKLFKELVNSL